MERADGTYCAHCHGPRVLRARSSRWCSSISRRSPIRRSTTSCATTSRSSTARFGGVVGTTFRELPVVSAALHRALAEQPVRRRRATETSIVRDEASPSGAAATPKTISPPPVLRQRHRAGAHRSPRRRKRPEPSAHDRSTPSIPEDARALEEPLRPVAARRAARPAPRRASSGACTNRSPPSAMPTCDGPRPTVLKKTQVARPHVLVLDRACPRPTCSRHRPRQRQMPCCAKTYCTKPLQSKPSGSVPPLR